MTCRIVETQHILALLNRGRRPPLSLEQLLQLPDGRRTVAYAVGAHAVIIAHAGGGTHVIEGTVCDGTWANDMLVSIAGLGNRAANGPEILRWVYRMGTSRRLRSEQFLNALYQVFHGNPSRQQVGGALFVWRWLDDSDLWNDVLAFEYQPRLGGHVMDVRLDGFSFELKNWHGVNSYNFNRWAGDQLLSDLESGALENRIWVFSPRITEGGGPSRAEFAGWITGRINEVIATARTSGTRRNLALVANNWARLQALGVEARFVIHDLELGASARAARNAAEESELLQLLDAWQSAAQ